MIWPQCVVCSVTCYGVRVAGEFLVWRFNYESLLISFCDNPVAFEIDSNDTP